MKSGLAVCGTILAAVLVLLLAIPAEANNIHVASVRMRNQDVAGKTLNVVFDLSWENSWRTDHVSCTNWDAAWVFVKFRPQGSNAWEHARLSATASDHNAPGGTIAVGSDGTNGVGVFVYSASVHAGGAVSYPQTRLKWNYGSNGYAFAKGAVIEISVQAIEMVYVPQGQFYLGSGGTEVGHFYRYTDGTQNTNPFLVSAEATNITVGTAVNAGNLYYTSVGGTVGDGLGIISNAFPKGYNAFYCMKYEISQGQYRNFLNLLPRAQQATRATIAADYFAMSGGLGFAARNGIRCPSIIPGTPTNVVFGCDANNNKTFNEIDDGMDLACNYLSWADGAAYADWAGLRPMSELEFEKACRGTAPPVMNEYAWGTTVLTDQTGLTNGVMGSGTETALPTNANCNYATMGFVPVRAGIYATTSSTRSLSGASYWGIMELSGNMVERPATVGNPTGRGFTGLHGDGVLDAAGDANVANWPTSGGVGTGVRGGVWYSGGLDKQCVSARDFISQTIPMRNGGSTFGWRGVRSAP